MELVNISLISHNLMFYDIESSSQTVWFRQVHTNRHVHRLVSFIFLFISLFLPAVSDPPFLLLEQSHYSTTLNKQRREETPPPLSSRLQRDHPPATLFLLFLLPLSHLSPLPINPSTRSSTRPSFQQDVNLMLGCVIKGITCLKGKGLPRGGWER